MTRQNAGGVFSTTSYLYDSLNRLTDLVNKSGTGGVVSSFHYTLRPDGKRQSVTEASGATTRYTYDDSGKLKQEAGPYATIDYGYDNVGNRITRSVTGAATGGGTTLVNGTTTNAYDANDRITAQSGPGGMVNHSYDDDGNETSVNGQLAAYDFENHLVGLNSGATSYVYDADGNRVSVTSGGVATGYVVDTSLPYASVVEEYAGSTLAARYDYGDDLVRMDRTTPSVSTSYYLFDGLGSTRQLVNISGTVTDSYSYSAFGELASRTGSTVNTFLFNAQQFDQPTGTYFLRARYYDQTNGRFISQDPYSGSNDDPVSLHRYLYASVDPVDRIDPGGQSDLPSLGAVLGGIAYLSGIAYSAYTFAGNPTAGNGAFLALSLIPGEGLLSIVGRLAVVAKVGKLANFLSLGIKDALSFAPDEIHMVNYLRNVRGVSHILFNESGLLELRKAVYGTIQNKKVLDGIGFVESTGKTILAEAKPQINGSDLLRTKQKFEDTYELLKEAAAREGQNFGPEDIDELVVVFKSKSGLSVNSDELVDFGGSIRKAVLDGIEKEIKYKYHP